MMSLPRQGKGDRNRRLIAWVIWVAVAGVAAVVAAATILGRIMGGEDDPRARPQSLPTVTSCPIGLQACVFAAQLNRLLVDGDFEAFIRHVESEQQDCPAPSRNDSSGLALLCQGAQAGERRDGYEISGGGFGALFSKEAYLTGLRNTVTRADPSQSDEYGAGAFRLYGLVCRDGAQATACPEEYGIVFTWIRPADPSNPQRTGREAWVFIVRQPDTDPKPRIATTSLVDRSTQRSGVVSLDDVIPWTPPS